MLKYLLFSGRIVDAEEALRCRLVQRVVPTGQLVPRVVSDFMVGVRDNGVCLLLRRLCCVPVMSRS